MGTDDFFTGNSELSIEFSKYVLEHPEVDDSLDEDSAIIFLPDYSPQLKEFNMGIAKELIKEGGKVTCRAKSGDEKAAAYLVSDLV